MSHVALIKAAVNGDISYFCGTAALIDSLFNTQTEINIHHRGKYLLSKGFFLLDGKTSSTSIACKPHQKGEIFLHI